MNQSVVRNVEVAVVDEELEATVFGCLCAYDVGSWKEEQAVCARPHDAATVYDEVYRAWPSDLGKQLSKSARATFKTPLLPLVYGEIDFSSFSATLSKVRTFGGLPVGGSFYDLGSGVGRPCVAAAVGFPLSKAVGIEYLVELHRVSKEAQRRYEEFNASVDDATSIDFVRGDFTNLADCDWTDGDVVFANSTCFDTAMRVAVSACALRLRKGAFFVSSTRLFLPEHDFQTLSADLVSMSWGQATVFIQKKITPPRQIPVTPVSPTWRPA
ncbi:hypothetical protein CTAYLR_008762 [Chrysophaeum taylorii]|uniref:Histone-lysine N-methyltransferase, H3 lysine-79 specific n=1 Tax=Chrysophaeum taylorii TaxID=2483200 RepID=A0AAD7XKA3_9STRA|nr:hypothetical protein CTAYLR_008762 [Chrysophaeum taylorii]